MTPKHNTVEPRGWIRVIGGKWRGRRIKVTSVPTLRPTPDSVRETLFNWLMGSIYGAHCLDLFAGTGALGFEALSRGAASAIFVEDAALAFEHLKKIVKTWSVTTATLVQGNALSWLKRTKDQGSPFDIVFLDPPFHSPLINQSLSLLIEDERITAQTLFYIENPFPFEGSTLSIKWEILKQGQAGEVYYYLLRVTK